MAETNKTTDGLRAEAKRAEEEMRARGSSAGETARETAKEYAQRARDEAYARGEAYRDYAAGETGKLASALRRAADDLADGSPQERLVARVADQVANAADQMGGMAIEDVYDEATSFARRHPGAFLAGAALTGFAAARFLKASAAGDDDGRADMGAVAPQGPRPGDYTAGARPMNEPASRPTGEPAARPMDDPTVPGPRDAVPGEGTKSTGATAAAGKPLDQKPV